VQTKFRILVRKDLRLGGPERVRHLQPVHGVRRTQFTGLDQKGEKAGNQEKEKKWAGEGPLRH
jgi:hypothetical protein